MNKLIIMGYGGHGKVIYDIAKNLKIYEDIKFLDDNYFKNDLVAGCISDFDKFKTEFDFIVGIGDNKTRKKYTKLLELNNAKICSIIDSSAIISDSSIVYPGTVIMPNVVVNCNSIIGNGVILNTGSIVEHDSIVGDFSHISPNVVLGGSVKIGKLCWLGIGSIVKNNIQVCDFTTIGAGSLVIRSILIPGIYYGSPCKKKEE